MTEWARYLCLTVLGPLLWLQGKYVRRVTPLLPEPAGARQGSTGQGPTLRLLIAGDSAAAGVGASSQDEALCGRLVGYLRPHCTVHWRLVAVNGLDSPGLLKLLEETRAEKFDVVVLSIGVNDVTGLRSPSQWTQWQDRLAQVIQTRFGPRLLIHSALPPMNAFTALPQPLRWFMGRWALEMNRQLAVALSAQTKRKLHWPLKEAVSGDLAADGFHPGPLGYAFWAESLSKVILLEQASS
jgi:lysophospholipase L1-like esterase